MSRNISRDMQHELYKLFSKGRGVSKRAERAKNDHKKSPYIHSRAYLESCLAEVKNYGQWLKEHGERGATMERARELAPAYIAEKRAAGGSAWSQNLTRSSLAKVFGCNARELGPVDRRDSRNITRGRDRSGDEKLGPIRAADRAVMQCVGLRHARECPQLTPAACRWEGGHIVSVHVTGKGGRERDARVLPGRGRDLLEERYTAAQSADERLVGSMSGVNVHAARADYAARAYELALAEGYGNGKYYEPEHAPFGRWDKGALDAVSMWMGHGSGRYETIVYNYLSYGRTES